MGELYILCMFTMEYTLYYAQGRAIRPNMYVVMVCFLTGTVLVDEEDHYMA